MALIKSNGNYLRITSVRTDNNTANYDIYSNDAARNRELNGTWKEFDIKKDGSFNTAIIEEIGLLAPPLTFKSINDNFKTICYVLMLCDVSAFGNASLDDETLGEINSMPTQEKDEFTNAVNYILENHPEYTEQTDKDRILTKLNLM